MSTIANKSKNNMEFRIVGLDIIEQSINQPQSVISSSTNFNFSINVESKVDKSKKIVAIFTAIQVLGETNSKPLGQITTSCAYEIINFNEIVKEIDGDQIEIEEQSLSVLNLISLSTTRGIMYTVFKGTYLHNAILPIIDPAQLIKTIS